jgi:hypothetical protein
MALLNYYRKNTRYVINRRLVFSACRQQDYCAAAHAAILQVF